MANPNPPLDNLKPFKGKDDPRNGRKPKGAIHISTHIQNMLNDEDFEMYLSHPTKGIEEFKGAPIKAIIKTAAIKAANNDSAAREWLAKYGWKPQLDITSNDEKIEGLVIIKNHDDKPLGLADKST